MVPALMPTNSPASVISLLLRKIIGSRKPLFSGKSARNRPSDEMIPSKYPRESTLTKSASIKEPSLVIFVLTIIPPNTKSFPLYKSGLLFISAGDMSLIDESIISFLKTGAQQRSMRETNTAGIINRFLFIFLILHLRIVKSRRTGEDTKGNGKGHANF